MTAAGPARVVIDTNVCLDLFLYHDSVAAPLRESLQSGAVTAITRADCREEWQRVLGYPQLGLDAARREELRAAYDACMRMLPPAAAEHGDAQVELPRCTDPDDQKFLQLAHQAGAGCLITRDKALLQLHRRASRRGLFAIPTPHAWCVRQSGVPA